MKASTITGGLALIFVLSLVLSVIHPLGNPRTNLNANSPLLEGADIPEEVRQVLEQKCADCHSEHTRWPTYSRFAPVSWFIERDVLHGRQALNLSQWAHYDPETQSSLLTRIASEARSGEMPPKPYLILHPHAQLTAADQKLLYEWAKAERKRVRKQSEAQSGALTTTKDK